MIDTPPATNRPLVWLRRYLPAELIGTLTALLCAWLAIGLTGNAAAAAVSGTWGGNLGFYGIIFGRELSRRNLRALPAILRDLVLEFGPATALDTLLLRPALMYAGMALVPHSAIGLIAGKLAADIIFYAPAIFSYELLRQRALPVMEELPL